MNAFIKEVGNENDILCLLMSDRMDQQSSCAYILCLNKMKKKASRKLAILIGSFCLNYIRGNKYLTRFNLYGLNFMNV